jgi:hypothetical protein
MANPPPPYANITGTSAVIAKYNQQESIANADGNARPGQLVIDVTNNNVYIGNTNGNLELINTGGGGAHADPAGPVGSLQYNAGGNLFGGTSNITISGNGLSVVGNITSRSLAVVTSNTQSFNPLFTDASATTAGATATASYTLQGPLCYFRVYVDFSTCTNFGTGQYQITLPFAAIQTMRIAGGTLHQTTGDSKYHIAGITDVVDSATVHKLYYSGSTTDLNWKYNTPIGGTTVTSHFDISGTYQIT